MAIKKKTIEEKYKSLDHIDHVLLRPTTYVGSNQRHTEDKWLVINGKMAKRSISYTPSFLKIFDEVITNSVDEHKRNSKLNKVEIKVNTDTGEISIKDNGGIPVVIHKEHKKYVPEVIFGDLMSGSNYDDEDDRDGAGTNGLGAKLTNIFSTKFTVSTCDGVNKFTQTFTNNMKKRTKAKVSAGKRKYTEITFTPEFKHFGMRKIDNNHFKMLEKRCYEVAACNPKLTVVFNGDKIDLHKFEDYIDMFTKDYLTESSKFWSISVAPSDDGFQHISFANTAETYDGGTHVDYIMNQIVKEMREYFEKKHKVDLRPSQLKNHMRLFLNCTVINPVFGSQTKEKLKTEEKDFKTSHIISKKFIQQLLKSEIVESILDWIKQKEEADESRKTRNLNKSLSKKKVGKLIDAKGRTRWKCQLGIFEGDSATSAFRKYRTPETMGAFPLKGKFMNVTDISSDKFVNNDEVVNLMASIGLKLGKEPQMKDLRYGRILLYVDADVDGNSIAGLLINFFYRYWPKLFEMNMVYKVETPVVVASKKGSKTKSLFYKQEQYQSWLNKVNVSNWEIKYKKGLAALVDSEYKEIINSPCLVRIDSSKNSEKYLDIWFGKDSDLRKKEMLK
jgi:DNA topoisomerase II